MPGSPTLQIASEGGVVLSAGTTYFIVLGGGFQATTADSGGLPYRSAGVLSKLGVRTTANATTGASTCSSVKYNNVAGSQTMSIPAGGSGVGYFEDVTYTDSVAGSGDKWSAKFAVGTGGTVTVTLVTSIFTATTNTVTKLISSHTVNITTATTVYTQITGNLGSAVALPTSETYTKTRITHAGTLKNLAVYNGIFGTGTMVVRVRQNAGNTTQVVTFTDQANTLLEDVTHTTTVAAGNDIDYSLTTSGGTVSYMPTVASVEYENTAGYGLTASTLPVALHQVDNSTQYQALGGTIVSNTTEATRQSKASAAFTLSNIGVLITGADSPNVYARLRKNGADTTMVALANSGGYVEDATHSEVVAATDLVDYSLFASSVGGTHYADTSIIRMSTYMSVSGNAVTKTMATETATVSEPNPPARLSGKKRAEATQTVIVEVPAGKPARLSTKIRAEATQTVTVPSETIARVKGKPRALSTETVTVPAGTLARLGEKIRALATQTASISESAFTRLAEKIRALTTQTVTAAESNIPTWLKARNVAKTIATETITIPAGTVARLKAALKTMSTESVSVSEPAFTKLIGKIRALTTQTIGTIGETVDRVVSAGAKNVVKTMPTETVTLPAGTLARLLTKLRTLSTETVTVPAGSLARLKPVIRSFSGAANTVLIDETVARLKDRMISLTTESITITVATFDNMRAKLRAITTQTVSLSESAVQEITTGAKEVVRSLSTETVAITATILTRVRRNIVIVSDYVTITVSQISGVVKTLEETVTIPAGTLVRLKTGVKALTTETITIPDGTLARLLEKIRALSTQTVTISETRARVKGKLRALATETSATVSEISLDLLREKIRTVTETVIISENVDRVVSGIKEVARTISATVTISATLARLKQRSLALDSGALAAEATFMDRLIEKVRGLATETTSIPAGSLTRSRAILHSTITTEIVSISETLGRFSARIRSLTVENVDLTAGTLVRLTARFRVFATESLAVSGTLSDRLKSSSRPHLTEIVAISDVLTRVNLNIQTLATQAVAISSSLIRNTAKLRAITTAIETPIQVSSNLTRISKSVKALATQTVTATDSTLSRLKTAVRTHTEGVLIADNEILPTLLAKIRSVLTETVTVSDTAARLKARILAAITEDVSINIAFETLTRLKNRMLSLSTQTIAVSETIERQGHRAMAVINQIVSVGESLEQQVSLSGIIHVVKSITQTVTLNYSFGRLSAKRRKIGRG